MLSLSLSDLLILPCRVLSDSCDLLCVSERKQEDNIHLSVFLVSACLLFHHEAVLHGSSSKEPRCLAAVLHLVRALAVARRGALFPSEAVHIGETVGMALQSLALQRVLSPLGKVEPAKSLMLKSLVKPQGIRLT